MTLKIDVIDSIRGKIDAGPPDIKIFHDSIDCLDKATEDFLDKMSAVSKDSDMSFNVKLRVRKSRAGGSLRERSPDNLGSFLSRVPFDNNNSTSLNFNNSVKHSSSRNSSSSSKHDPPGSVYSRGLAEFISDKSYDDVFENSVNVEGVDNCKSYVADSSLASTDASRDDIDVSSDTCTRLDELDNKVRSLWTKLSTKDESFEVFKSDKKDKFTNSVNKLKEDLSESIQHHNKFLKQVNVAKKLFSSPSNTN